MKKIIILALALLSSVAAFATEHSAKDKPTRDTIFRKDTTDVITGMDLIIRLQREGWSLYGARILKDEQVEITSFRIGGSKSAPVSDEVPYVPDGTYESVYYLPNGGRYWIVLVIKDGDVVDYYRRNEVNNK